MTSPDLDGILRAALSSPMTTRQLASLDHRVRDRLHGRAPAIPRRRGLVVGGPRVVVGLAAASILLAGTAVAGATLFGQLVGGAPLLEHVWARATDVGVSASDAGYTAVLEKAAVDPDRVWVALSASGADIFEMRVIDANGVVMAGGTGAGTGIVDGRSASLFGFQIPDGVAAAGPYTLEVTRLHVAGSQVAGDWTFVFDPPVTPAWEDSATEATSAP